MAALQLLRSVSELRTALDAERRAGRRVGFVPTMGALHAGHGSLVSIAAQRSDCVVASIFVNPLQFGPSEDLARYPRTPEADMKLLEAAGCRYLFMPEAAEVYPDGYCTTLHMSALTNVLCGQSRPGHFDGVLTVVLKLFQMVEPQIAFFGRKDFQQALVIRRMARDLNLRTEIAVCPIVREADGLAMSSRNRYLGSAERAVAAALRQAVLRMDAAFRAGRCDAETLLALGAAHIAAQSLFCLDYLEIRDPETLAARSGVTQRGDLVAVAAQLGGARLIDNGLLGEECAP